MRQHHAIGLAAIALLAAVTGCDEEYDPNAPAIDPNAPRIHITSPARGTFAGDVTSVAVKGIATDDSGAIASVTINGVAATVEADGTFVATVPVDAGTNLLHAVAKDAQGNTGKETRAVVAGALEPIKSVVPQAITASMTAQTFDALGRGVTGYLTGANLTTLATPYNPVVDWGTTNSQPDCLYGQAMITSVTLGSASKLSFAPQPGGIWLQVELDRPRIGTHLQWAVSCFDGSREVAVSASHITISGMLTVGIKQTGVFDIHFDHPNVQITGFDVDLGGVPGEIVDILHLDTALGPVLGFVAERFAVPYLNKSLAGLNETKTVDVLGKKVDVKIQPRAIDFDVVGATIELDSTLRAQGDTASPGFVYVTDDPPVMDMSQGFQLAVVDNAANQLLGSFWAAKGMDVGLDLANGSYGEVGTLYDRVELSAAVPPFVDAHHGALRLVVGDLLGTFKNGPVIATQVAINAEVKLEVVTDATGLRIDVGTPDIYVDVLDENVDGANQLSNAQFEAISSFGLSRIVAFGSGSLGAIPLPSFGGVAVKNVKIKEQTGYVVVGGSVE